MISKKEKEVEEEGKTREKRFILKEFLTFIIIIKANENESLLCTFFTNENPAGLLVGYY